MIQEIEKLKKGRNPLESGQCFLLGVVAERNNPRSVRIDVAIPSNRVNVSYMLSGKKMAWWTLICRNPLESGQCFLHTITSIYEEKMKFLAVAIPSNRVNVSYSDCIFLHSGQIFFTSRNPLESGQCFLLKKAIEKHGLPLAMSQSPRIGSMFPTIAELEADNTVPEGVWSQSPRIGSMFPTS